MSCCEKREFNRLNDYVLMAKHVYLESFNEVMTSNEANK